MKILQVPTGGLISDGILSCVVDYMAAMDKSDVDVRVLATNNAEALAVQKVEQSGCTVHSIPYRKEHIIKYFLELYRYISEEKIDIVHVHGSSAIMSVELLAASLAGCKVRIAHSHNTTCDHTIADKLLRPIFNKAYTVAFACGKEAGRWMFQSRHFTIIPNGRDIKKYQYDVNKRQQYRNELNVTDDSLVIGHVGSFNRQKNHKYLVHIFYELYRRNIDAYLVLIGSGETMRDIKKLVQKLSLEKNVIFLGNSDKVSAYLSAFDIMLLPSLYEGLPMVVIESQINGLPCIVSDTVTKECKITSTVSFESIKQHPVIWAMDICHLKLPDREKNRESALTQVREAGYDIAAGAERLKKIYRAMLEESLWIRS